MGIDLARLPGWQSSGFQRSLILPGEGACCPWADSCLHGETGARDAPKAPRSPPLHGTEDEERYRSEYEEQRDQHPNEAAIRKSYIGVRFMRQGEGGGGSMQVPDGHLLPDAIVATVVLLQHVTVSLAIDKLNRWQHVLLNLHQKKAPEHKPSVNKAWIRAGRIAGISINALDYPLRLDPIQARLPGGELDIQPRKFIRLVKKRIPDAIKVRHPQPERLLAGLVRYFMFLFFLFPA